MTWLAYYNWGRWVADCPRPCGSAMMLTPGQPEIACETCHQVAPIEWPANAPQITAVLTERPAEGTRNWFPKGHPLAVRGGLPHGQSVSDLDAETRKQMAPPEVIAIDELGDLRGVLAGHGYDISDDGKTLRRL